MSQRIRFALKTLAWLVCLAPLMRLGWQAASNSLGPDPVARLAHSTGWTALLLLTLSLAITPLRRLSPALGEAIRFRRLLGLFAFFYATVHLLIYAGLYAGFDGTVVASDLLRRRFAIAGAVAWLLLLPLAATSTQGAIRILGGRRWRSLHRLVYLAAVGALIHFWWQVKPGVLTPLGFTVALAVLLALRLLPARKRPGREQEADGRARS